MLFPSVGLWFDPVTVGRNVNGVGSFVGWEGPNEGALMMVGLRDGSNDGFNFFEPYRAYPSVYQMNSFNTSLARLFA